MKFRYWTIMLTDKITNCDPKQGTICRLKKMIYQDPKNYCRLDKILQNRCITSTVRGVDQQTQESESGLRSVIPQASNCAAILAHVKRQRVLSWYSKANGCLQFVVTLYYMFSCVVIIKIRRCEFSLRRTHFPFFGQPSSEFLN